MMHTRQIESMFHETHFLFQEANEIAEELEKFLSFELCLVNKGGPGADVPSSGAEGEDGDEEEEKKEDKTAYLDMLNNGLDVDDLDVMQYETFPAEFWVKVVNTSGENPEELWHMLKFKNRLEMMRGMWTT
jgi:hypothetical protein